MPTAPPPRAQRSATPDLPHPLTFFLTASQRAQVLRALRRIHPDRATALRIALDIEPGAEQGIDTRTPPTTKEPS